MVGGHPLNSGAIADSILAIGCRKIQLSVENLFGYKRNVTICHGNLRMNCWITNSGRFVAI